MKQVAQFPLLLIVIASISGCGDNENSSSAQNNSVSLIGKSMQIGPNSTPLCTNMENLNKFATSMLKGDSKSAMYVCYMGKEGMDIEVIEDYHSLGSTRMGHVVRVNVIGGGTAIPAYTLSNGIVPR